MNIKIGFTVILYFLLTLQGYSQWSTSTIAESTLYACPGFYPGIVTFDDGSSIVLGALYHSIYARKLDEYGYYLWSQPVLVHYNNLSAITDVFPYGDWGGWISDGDDGVILFWYDHRGAYDTGTDWANNAIYVQRVDKYGVVRWTPGGVLVKGPMTGFKDADIVSDGVGGFVLVWTESGFGYPGAPNKEYLISVRYNVHVQKVWEIAIDSSTVRYTLQRPFVARGGARLYIRYYANGSFSRVVNLDGNVITMNRAPTYYLATEKDSVVYLKDLSPLNNVVKLGTVGDTLWVTEFTLSDSCQALGGRLLPDAYGGTYFLNICKDSIIHIDSTGNPSRKLFSGIGYGGQGFPDGNHGIVLASATISKRYNEFGQMTWPSPVVYLQDPGNAYFTLYTADKNGGIIATYWTTRGGIFAHHTGRYGRVGIITGIGNEPIIPIQHDLIQNYPNPFNSSTIIKYLISKRSYVKLEVFDILGRTIKHLVNEYQDQGEHQTIFQAEDLSTGIYIYRLSIDGNIINSKKMLILR